MRAIYSPAKGGAWVLTAILVATACHSDLKPNSPGLEQQLREVSLVAERDSLVQEVAANGRLLTDLQGELDKVGPVTLTVKNAESSAPETGKDQRRVALERVREITTRLRAADARLVVVEARARKLGIVRDSLTEAQGTITGLETAIAEQKSTVANLAAQLDLLGAANQVLADSLYQLADAQNTVYYVVGTRKELLAKGVLVEDGHRSVPLVGRRSVQPARDLPLGEFTSINRTDIHEVPLPRSDRDYRIVSRQNLAHLASGSANGRVRGAITIESPAEFWEGSRYLIVVEQ